MIIGNGLLARSFARHSPSIGTATIFASGVSNSGETAPSAFERERDMLTRALQAAEGRTLVYFSTCSIDDRHRGHTPYVEHKLRMESLVMGFPGNFVLRLPQVVGNTPNPNTLTNFIANHIRSGTSFDVWLNAVRCIIDVDTVAGLTMELLLSETTGFVADLAPPETTTMEALVEMMEKALGKRSNHRRLEVGGGSVPDSALALELAAKTGDDLSLGYTRRTIFKYYEAVSP